MGNESLLSDNVVLWAFADIEVCVTNVCFTLERRHSSTWFPCPLSAISGNRRPEIGFAQTPVAAGYRRPMGNGALITHGCVIVLVNYCKPCMFREGLDGGSLAFIAVLVSTAKASRNDYRVYSVRTWSRTGRTTDSSVARSHRIGAMSEARPFRGERVYFQGRSRHSGSAPECPLITRHDIVVLSGSHVVHIAGPRSPVDLRRVPPISLDCGPRGLGSFPSPDPGSCSGTSIACSLVASRTDTTRRRLRACRA
jgi:hypothetical protein